MIRLQQRDLDIMNDIGLCEVLTYSQIQKLHFDTYQSCVKRMSNLQKYKYVYGTFYNTNEKVFRLDKDGVKVLGDLMDKSYRVGEYGHIFHKIMRSELYTQVKKQNISEWKNEVTVPDVNKVYDASFEHDGKLYLVEIHNEQKSKVLKERLIESLKIKIPFTLLIYCKNKNTVKALIDNLNSKGFENDRSYNLAVYKLGEEVLL